MQPATTPIHPVRRDAGASPRRLTGAAWLATLLAAAWLLASVLARWPGGSVDLVITWQVAMASALWIYRLVDACLRPSAGGVLHGQAAGPASLWRQLLHSAQLALWLLLPGVGWLALNAQGEPALLVGLVPLPELLPADAALHEALVGVHLTLAWALGLLLAAQALAAWGDAARGFRRSSAARSGRPAGSSADAPASTT